MKTNLSTVFTSEERASICIMESPRLNKKFWNSNFRMFNCGQNSNMKKFINLFLGLSLFVSMIACKGEDGDVGQQHS
jgi:hypothetical protein